MNISFKGQERICVPLMRNDYEKINKAVLEIPEAVSTTKPVWGFIEGLSLLKIGLGVRTGLLALLCPGNS